MVLKVRLSATPTATLHADTATLRLQPFVEVLAVASNSAFQSLFSLDLVSEVGQAGLGERADGSQTSLPATFSSCALLSHTGLLTVPSVCYDFLASGPLHVLYPVPKTFFSRLLAWLASSHLLGLSLNVVTFFMEAFLDHQEKDGPR